MRTETVSIVDSHYSGIFSIDEGVLWRGVSVRPHGDQLAGYEGFYVAWRAGGVHISAPARADSPALDRLRQTSLAELQSVSFWRTFATATGSALIGPSTHAFLDKDPGLDEAGIDVSAAELYHLRTMTSDAEWDEAGFNDEPKHVFGWHENRALIAASNLTAFQGEPRDVGVLVARSARGRGLATVVARQAVSYAVRSSGLARWRARNTNAPSLAVARKLGFEPWCTQLAIR